MHIYLKMLCLKAMYCWKTKKKKKRHSAKRMEACENDHRRTTSQATMKKKSQHLAVQLCIMDYQLLSKFKVKTGTAFLTPSLSSFKSPLLGSIPKSSSTLFSVSYLLLSLYSRCFIFIFIFYLFLGWLVCVSEENVEDCFHFSFWISGVWISRSATAWRWR